MSMTGDRIEHPDEESMFIYGSLIVDLENEFFDENGTWTTP